MKPFGILAWPAWATKEANPYNYLLYSNVEEQGYEIHEFHFNIRNIIKWIFSNKYKVFHIHWPTNILAGNSYYQALRYVITFQIFLICLRLMNKKIVWTVHNLEAHETKYPSLQKKLDKILYRNVHGFISLNKAGLPIIKKRAGIAGQVRYVPHPHYKGYYPDTTPAAKARATLGIRPGQFVFLFLGQIRRYKNVTGLVEAFNDISDPSAMLLIAGSVHSEVREELMAMTEGNRRIILADSFVKNEDLQLYMNCADLVVTPYDRIFNSGSVFLNLSFNKPTLAPNLGAMAGLQETVGSHWIRLYDGAISARVLENAMRSMNTSSNPAIADLSHFDPASVATQTANFYQELVRPASVQPAMTASIKLTT